MTIGIGAISRRDNTIVTVTDFLLSTSTASIDTDTVKVDDPAPGWLSMFSGDPSAEEAVVRRVRESMAGVADFFPAIVGAFRVAYQAELKAKIDAEILSPFGLDRDRFMADGREELGDEEFSRFVYKIGAADLETDFLVAGFDSNGAPRLFSVSNPGVCTQHTGLGFHAIGVGGVAALGSLYATYSKRLSTSELIYRACEAKFRSEAAPGVGKKTYVVVIEDTGEQSSLHPDHVSYLCGLWEQRGKPPVPPEAVEFIRKSLSKLTWSDKPPRKEPMS